MKLGEHVGASRSTSPVPRMPLSEAKKGPLIDTAWRSAGAKSGSGHLRPALIPHSSVVFGGMHLDGLSTDRRPQINKQSKSLKPGKNNVLKRTSSLSACASRRERMVRRVSVLGGRWVCVSVSAAFVRSCDMHSQFVWGGGGRCGVTLKGCKE